MFSDSSAPPQVSVVTPAYNEEKYLATCIESVLAQTYTHWDYLIVDNCSTDGTLAIAQHYAAQDSRIRVVSNSSVIPAVANFNRALRGVSPGSKYCKMVLADDWILPECLERMVALMEAHPNVGITGAYGIQGQWVLWEGVPYETPVISGRDICRDRLLGGPYVFGSPTSVLFRADLVRSRTSFYRESNIHAADSETCFELLTQCDFGFVHQVLTFSRVREGSLLEASMELNASAADMLYEIVTFGPRYLTRDELQKATAAAIGRYYDFLAGSLFRRQDERFWQYHRSRLEATGPGFSRTAVVRAAGRRILHRLRLRGGSSRRWGL